MTTTPPTTPPDVLEALREALDELRLADMKAALEEQLERPEDVPWLERFYALVEAQRRGRQERAIARRLKEAGFPANKSLETFDFEFQTGVDKDQILHLATLDWLKRRKSILFGGMSGTGKSHLAIALGQLACVHGYRVCYRTSASLLTALHLAHATGDLQQGIKPFVRCDLLVVDEVGLDRPERQAYRTDDASLLYKVVAARYEANRSCIVTTNIEWDAWGAYLGDDVATAAILDRLAHHSYSVNIVGPSWRAKEHKRLNNEVGD